MSNAETLINQAKGAYSEAEHFRQMAVDKQRAEQINIEDAFERSQQAASENDSDNARYWSERAELLTREMNDAVRDLQDRAQQKQQEGQRYEADASAEAAREGDNDKRQTLLNAIRLLGGH